MKSMKSYVVLFVVPFMLASCTPDFNASQQGFHEFELGTSSFSDWSSIGEYFSY